VVPSIPPQVVEGGYKIVYATERLSQEADNYLRTIADQLSSNGLRVLTTVRIGEAATEIVASARECDADVIAMMTHGRTALGRLLFGAVAEAVLRRAHVPVFIVPATEARERTKAALKNLWPARRRAA
jgi:nucleotide-binding universal stress UspA family protein